MDTFLAIASRPEVRQYADRDIPDEVVRRILEAGRIAGGTSRLIAVREQALLDRLAETVHAPDNLNGAPVAVVIVLEGGGGFNSGRAAQNMVLAAWNEGVGSCATRIVEAEQAREILDLPESEQPLFALAFGYPLRARRPESRPADDWLEFGKRKSFDEVVEFR